MTCLLCIYYGNAWKVKFSIYAVMYVMYVNLHVMYAILHVMYAAYMTTNLPLHDVWPRKHSALSEFYCCILYISTWCMLLDKL